MNITFKKIAAAVSAVVLAGTLSGCALENGYIMTVDDIDIRSGVYISFEQDAIDKAYDIIEQRAAENAESDGDGEDADTSGGTSADGSAEEYNIFDEVIDGKSFSDWVKEETLKGVKRYVGIKRQCEEFGIALSDEEIAEINSDIQEEWDSGNFYVQYYYGFSTLGEYYSSMGIGIESLKEIEKADRLNNLLFLHYYGEGGQLAVPDDEIDPYIEENYAAYRLITLQFLDYRGDLLTSDLQKQEILDRAQEYADRINKGESFADVYYDFNLLTAQNKAKADAEDSYDEMFLDGLLDEEGRTPDGLTEEEYVLKAINSATATKGESDSMYDEVASKDHSILTDELTDYLFSLPADSKAYVYEGTTSAYVVVRMPADALSNWKASNIETILHELRDDAFDSFMDLACQNYKVSMNEYLVNKKYSPEKILK